MASRIESSGMERLSALVVDNSPVTRTIHVALLRAHGFASRVTENGNQAVNLIRFGERFDVIFIKIHDEVNAIEVSYFTRLCILCARTFRYIHSTIIIYYILFYFRLLENYEILACNL